MRPIQKILFGSPGTGKSYRIRTKIADELKIDTKSENYISTVFHPEYTYGDFIGKLVPFTVDKKVEYNFYRGHFLNALGKAYKNLINARIQYDKDKKSVLDNFKKEIEKSRQDDFSDEELAKLEGLYSEIEKKPENVLLVIDELNRGNSAAIFGIVFQLLDRNSKGWSEYPITVSELEKIGLLKKIGLEAYIKDNNKKHEYEGQTIEEKKFNDYLNWIFEDLPTSEKISLQYNQIKIPPNLHLVATMNTSDNSICFMDNAFKRRWDWEFLNIEDDNQRDVVSERKLMIYGEDKGYWNDFVDKLNSFIRGNYKVVRKIEDKQIGYFFINEDKINENHIKNKLMFFVWDSVFNTNKKPLVKLLEVDERDLVTFGQFTQEQTVKSFINKIIEG